MRITQDVGLDGYCRKGMLVVEVRGKRRTRRVSRFRESRSRYPLTQQLPSQAHATTFVSSALCYHSCFNLMQFIAGYLMLTLFAMKRLDWVYRVCYGLSLP